MATGTSYRLPGTLPRQKSGFVGREAELARTRELLRRYRLVTVTGPGGVGKTRLAVRVADESATRFRDGAYLAELSALRDPRLLVHTLAAGLAAAAHNAEADQVSQLDVLLGFLREREMLLVLDTCEHLIDACAELADVILRAAPGVTILATSRQPFDTAGEVVQQLCPLPVPEPGSASAGKADAVELFAQRAAAGVPGFTVPQENLADVISVCERLDGIPLAIELAAVRLRALPLHQMAERIDDRLRLLTGGRRSGVPRHQTLRAAVEWSYLLCTPAERLLWARLSVFADGFDIAAAEEVCAGGDLARDQIVPTLISLVDKSLLFRGNASTTDLPASDGPSEQVFRMLGMIREFGAELLHLASTQAVARRRDALPDRVDADAADIGQAEAAVRRRFIAHYLALAERFEREPTTDQVAQYRRLRREHANLRAAFDYALDLPGSESAAVVLATSLFVYWRISGLLREAEYWLDQASMRCPKRSVVRARVLSMRGYIRVLLGDFVSGRADAEEAIAMAAPLGDQATAGRGYSVLYRALAFSENLADAQKAEDAAADCLSSVGDVLELVQLDIIDAMLRLQAGELDRCYDSVSMGLDRLPDDEVWCSAYLYGLRSLALFLRGDIELATPAAMLMLEMKLRIRDEVGIAWALALLAFIAAGQGRRERTGWLFGASAPLWERAGRWYNAAPVFEALHEVAERVARTGLGDDTYWKLYAAGAAAAPGHVIERALADADQLGEPTARS